MEIKVGDKVRVREDAPRIYTQNCLNLSLHNTDFEVTNIDDGCANIQSKDCILTIAYVIPTKYLIKVNAEADANEKLQEEYARFMSGHTPISFADRIEREHIQRRMRVLSQDDFLKDFNPAEHEVNPKPHYTPKIMFNTKFWIKYEADLAKEIAVKLSDPNESKPGYVADYAVSVAKAVVENLKKK